MKKYISLMLVVSIIASLFVAVPTTVSAAREGIYTYSISNGEATITDCSSSASGEIVIPSTLGGYPVTIIGYGAFQDCKSLASITIPNSVTSIGTLAFRDCTSLTSIIIPDSVTRMGDFAFYNCDSLSSISMPDNMTSIGDNAFEYCEGLTSITIPNGVTSIGYATFAGCENLISIVMPNSVTSIGGCAFSRCHSLISITIPNSVTSIGHEAFYGCYSLTSIAISDSVTSIGDWAFDHCTGLTSITVDENNKYYSSDNYGVLYNKEKTQLLRYLIGKSEKMFVIPSSVTSIGDGAFSGCSGLTSITIPNSVTCIGPLAFRDCTSLTSIIIPDSVTRIGDGAFYNCDSLSSISMPDNMTSIGDNAFGYCESLTSITIPNGVTSIGYATFAGCENLISIVMPNSVTSIGYEAFARCDNLTNITIPGSVKIIDSDIFEKCCNLTDITLQYGVESIGDYAFSESKYLTSITIPNSVTSIGDHAFSSCTSLTSITIPNSVIDIGRGVFCCCSGLTSITIPNSVTSIANSAFSSCTSLTNIIIPDSVTSIGDWAFEYCESLTGITIPDSVTSIGDKAFYYCRRLTDVYYTGSELDWNKISIGSDNEWLTNANIHYNYSPVDPAKKYSIKFNLNGGIGTCTEQEVSEGNYVVAPDKPTREGYVFTGWYANKLCSGQPYITSSGTVNQKVTNDIILYAGWEKAEKFDFGTDTFSFNNDTFFFKNPEFERLYLINDEYYSILKENASLLEKMLLSIHRKAKWEGSCYGMCAIMALVKMGKLDTEFFQSSASMTYDFMPPKELADIASLVNFYQMTQNLSEISSADKSDTRKSTKEIAKELVESLCEKPDEPQLLGISYKVENEYGKLKWAGHEILAIGIEKTDEGYRVKIADPNFMVKTDRDASSSVWIPNDESYLDVEDNYNTLTYMERQYGDVFAEYSTAENTFKLDHVLGVDEYGFINLQEELENLNSVGAMMLFSDTEAEEFSTLYTNFSEFEITDNNQSAVVQEDVISGELEISEPLYKSDVDTIEYGLNSCSKYRITANTEQSLYNASVIYNNENSCYIDAASELKPIIEFDPVGAAKIATEESCNKSISISNMDNLIPWIGVSLNATVKDLSVANTSSGEIYVSSSESLNNAVITIHSDGGEDIITMDEDVNSFTIGFKETDSKKYIYVTTESKIIEEELTCAVVFHTLGGSIVDSISGVKIGNTIAIPDQPVREGFIFGGWYIDVSYTLEWDFETDVVTDNLNLYAKWEEDPDYYKTATFVNVDETVQIIMKNGETLSLKEHVSLFDKEGYELLGWNTTEDETYIEYNTEASLTLDDDITLYAVMRAKVPYTKSTVTKNGNSCAIETTICDVSTSCSLLVAGYKNKQLVTMERRPYSQAQETFNLSGDIDEIKVMLWDGFAEFKPLSDAEVIPSEEWEIQ